LEVVILGSGTFIPLPERSSPSVLVRSEKTNLLLDIGPGTLRQLSKAGLSFTMIDYVLISHFHPDHTADIIHLLFVLKNTDPSFIHPITILGPSGTKDFIRGLQNAYRGHLNLSPRLLKIDEMGKKSIRNCKDLTVNSYPVKHTSESIGFRIEDISGKKIAYSGDTGLCEEVIQLCKDVDLAILECSFPEEYLKSWKIDTHLSPSDAGKIAKEANVKNLILTHLYPECFRIDIISRCKTYYKGKIIVAKDLFRINI